MKQDKESTIMVPVVDSLNQPLMPTISSRARRWIEQGKATPFWKFGIFCVRLNQKPSSRYMQSIILGIDPGSKKEGFTVKSEVKTFVNIQADAVHHVKMVVDDRKILRRNRRGRKTPYRKCRLNRSCQKNKTSLPPSTKARWDLKLRIFKNLKKLFPITDVAVEDVAAKSKKRQRKWNKSFSPIQTGKKYFYRQIKSLGVDLHLFKGYDTFELRKRYDLEKSSRKLDEHFHVHCVDSWVIADSVLGGNGIIDNKKVICVSPIRFHRRQLHEILPKKNGFRKKYGSTRSMGLKRGSLVRHLKYGVCYVGGTSIIENKYERISLHSFKTGERLCQNAKVEDCKFLCYNGFKVR